MVENFDQIINYTYINGRSKMFNTISSPRDFKKNEPFIIMIGLSNTNILFPVSQNNSISIGYIQTFFQHW